MSDSIIDLFDNYHIPYGPLEGGHRHTRLGWLNTDCFSCSPYTQKWKLGIKLSSLYCNCWTCGTFPLSTVLEEILKISHQEARRLAYQLKGSRDYDYAPGLPQAATGILKIPKGVGPLQKQHKGYLEGRGFNVDNLEKLWKIGGIGLASRLSWRVFIPVFLHGEIVSWTTRSISDEIDLPYINASPGEEGLPLKSLLMGEDYVRHSVIIVEGPLDCMKGGPGFCCTFGVQYTQEQLRRIAKFPCRVIAMDNEPLAQRQARRLVNELSAWPGETYNVVLSSGKDASRASDEDLSELRRRFLE